MNLNFVFVVAIADFVVVVAYFVFILRRRPTTTTPQRQNHQEQQQHDVRDDGRIASSCYDSTSPFCFCRLFLSLRSLIWLLSSPFSFSFFVKVQQQPLLNVKTIKNYNNNTTYAIMMAEQPPAATAASTTTDISQQEGVAPATGDGTTPLQNRTSFASTGKNTSPTLPSSAKFHVGVHLPDRKSVV